MLLLAAKVIVRNFDFIIKNRLAGVGGCMGNSTIVPVLITQEGGPECASSTLMYQARCGGLPLKSQCWGHRDSRIWGGGACCSVSNSLIGSLQTRERPFLKHIRWPASEDCHPNLTSGLYMNTHTGQESTGENRLS